MQRLKQHWKVVAYFAGMAALTLTPFKEVFAAGFVGGVVWLFVWIIRTAIAGNGSARAPDLFDGDDDRMRQYNDTMASASYSHLSYNIHHDSYSGRY